MLIDTMDTLLERHRTWRIVGQQVAIPCVFMRGGTSRGAFLRVEDMPADRELLQRAITAIYGSPDPRQIDGIGGADPLTSKVAIVGRSSREDADVDFTFGQVRILEPVVDFDGNCGNISAAVGPFAIEEGFVPAVEPVTRVRIHLTNTSQILVEDVPVQGGRMLVEGEAEVPGVPGSGAPILMDMGDTAGTLGNGVLPTASPTDLLEVGGDRIRATIIDAGNATVLVDASAVGMGFGRDALEPSAQALARLEAIRAAAAVRLGLVDRTENAAAMTPAVPKMYWVGPPTDYATRDGRYVRADEMSFAGAGLTMGVPHKAYAVTAAVATAVAALVPGSLVHAVADERARTTGTIRIGHPGGVMALEAQVRIGADGVPQLSRVAVQRTARRIMDGFVYVPLRVFGPRLPVAL